MGGLAFTTSIPLYSPLNHLGLIIFPSSVIAKIRAESPESLCVQNTPGYFLLLIIPDDSTISSKSIVAYGMSLFSGSTAKIFTGIIIRNMTQKI